MSRDLRPLVAGNWKMNGLKAALDEIAAMRRGVEAGKAGSAEILVCPPATLIISAAARARGRPGFARRDRTVTPRRAAPSPAIFPRPMLKDAGAAYVIVGHSERRAGHGENDALVRAKAEAAHQAGLTAIVCVGETRAEREAGEAISVVSGQIRGSLPPRRRRQISSSPTSRSGRSAPGLTPTADDVAAMHGAIRALLEEIYGAAGAQMRILYGGSVKPSNAAELLSLPNVNGALVGGASLKAADFLGIAAAYV